MLTNGDRWSKFQEGSVRSYQNYLNGTKNDLEHHNVIQEANSELSFIHELLNNYTFYERSGSALDVGCGTGHLTNQLNANGYFAVGFDLSEDAIKIAESLFKSEIEFFIGDGATPKAYFCTGQFHLIIAREFHPFTRINEPILQKQIVEDYLDLLDKNGVLVIAHSEVNSHIDFNQVKEWANQNQFISVGPYFYSMLKKLPFIPRNRFTIPVASKINSLLARIMRRNHIQFLVIQNKQNY